MSTTLLVDPPPVATAPPASRASWSGQLRLGSCCVPVKAYPTISSSSGVALRQLHAGCGEHIEYHKCCLKHGRVPAPPVLPRPRGRRRRASLPSRSALAATTGGERVFAPTAPNSASR